MKNKLKKIIDKVIESALITYTTPFREIKYFHPDGISLPNGSYYQRGGFLNECRINRNMFIIDEAVHDKQYGLSDYRGGVIVFSTDLNAVQLDTNIIKNKIKQFIVTWRNRLTKGKKIHNIINDFNANNNEYIGAYSVGNFFHGRYVGDNGEKFDEKSLCLEINGLSSLSLLKIAENIAKSFGQETVLVKDLNSGKIYLADQLDSKETFDDAMSRINSKC